jgi:plasmid stabilization system protein ParE
MAHVELAPEVFDDFDRIIAHLEQYQDAQGAARVEEIMQAIDVLEHNPLIGRPAQGDKRELVIGRKPRGFLALYHYVDALDTVFVLAVRSQREAAYVR